ncbi:MAG: 50S ribosomal protein L25/general stress protein Ctc [Proteobacteria bacterium]|nr:50S ribosomal protein L25/general stress protein Ctc [Pseudomonadota bacterium]MBU2226650.1 50S ribosomal protein L25/general stress protein Ctc [Pseudomonadota bacterium]MBU2261276.1 50S ribosomal protein L25/general stress protein Ctc [Pseudomonadota bacterium]
MEATELKACIRKESGKGPARRIRKEGLIPAVFYGRGEEAIPLSVNAAGLRKIIKEKGGNVFIRLLIEGQERQERLSLIKELQIEPVSRRFQHADFYEIRVDHKLTIDVPLHFTGTPVGVVNGGELQQLKRDLKISCLPSSLPDFIEVDVSGLEIGDSLKVQDIRTPDDIAVLDPGDVGVVMVAVMKVSAPKAEEEAEGEAAAEGEASPKESEKG